MCLWTLGWGLGTAHYPLPTIPLSPDPCSLLPAPARPLLNKPLHQDGVFDVQVLPALEADGNRAVEDIEGPMPLDIARIGTQLLAKRVAVGIIVSFCAADNAA